jgi:hypothetical protein
METIYEVYSFESNSWVESDKQTYDREEDKYRRVTNFFRQPNRFDLMSTEEKAITLCMWVLEKAGAGEHLTNAGIKLSQARDLVYEHYRTSAT